jgi:hypothetical protein
MKTQLSKIKVNSKYEFQMVENGGAGSGSQYWYNVKGMVKEINAEFIRVIPIENLLEGNKRSIKLKNHNILGVEVI